MKRIFLLILILSAYQGSTWANKYPSSFDFFAINERTLGENEDCDPEEVDGLLVFEAERFELNGDWKLGEEEGASGGKYIYFDGPNSYQQYKESNVISYDFKINNPGTYSFKWVMRQPAEEAGGDLGNDAWFYFSDDIGYGNGQALTTYYKFVGRSDLDFTLNGVAEVNHEGRGVTVVFDTAGIYTLNLSGRSHGFELDRIVLYKGISFDELPSRIALISETNTCEEEDDNPTGEEISLINPFTTFDDSALEMSLNINYDAIETRTIKVDLTELDGTVISSVSTEVDSAVGGEKEVMLTLSEPLLWNKSYIINTALNSDSTTIRLARNSFVVIADPASNTIEFVDFPEIINQPSNVVRMKYEASVNRDILLQLRRNDSWTVKTVRFNNLPKGSYERDFTIELGTLPGDGNNYTWRAIIRVNGAPWPGNISLIETGNIIVDKDFVSSTDEFRGLEKIMVFVKPNPSTDQVTIDIPKGYSFQTLEVVDSQGKVVLRKENVKGTLDLDLNVAKGVYFLKFKSPKFYGIQKIIRK
ncbi:MAG: T9SS type A sorting domain-containing protein [Bacteroidota bacterium]